MRYVVSACLAGEACRYDGTPNPCEAVLELVRTGQALPVCPECLGGLSTPRVPCEVRGERVVNRVGEDVTAAFRAGAEAALRMALDNGCTHAVLKSRSPSCGFGRVYDGSFSGKTSPGNGLFARLALEAGLIVASEETFDGSRS